MNERLHAIVRGKVQLVMYRDFTQRKASGLKLTGKVLNRPDGTVEIVAEGPQEKLEALIIKLRKGPILARVDAIDEVWHPATGEFTSFVIAYE
jgi:acylphosphatase